MKGVMKGETDSGEMEGEPKEFMMKVVVVGDAKAGKTALLQRGVHDIFTDVYKATIGVDFKLKALTIPPPPAKPTTLLRMQVWDTAGSERFGELSTAYYRAAAVGLVVFDLVTSGPDSDSLDGFNNVPQWFENGRKYAPSDCILFLAGTHLDEYLAIDKRQEDRDGAEAKLHAMVKASLAGWGLGAVPFFAVSAKDGTNVQELMTDMGGRWMARKIVRTRQLLVQASQWGVKSTLMLDVPIEKAEEESAGPDVVTAGNVAAAFVKTHKEATLKDVIVARNRSHDRNVPGASQSAAPPLPLTHAAVTELPPSGGGGLLFRLLRRQPLTAGLHCEFYNAAVQHVTKVILEEADGGSGRKLTGYASDGTYVTLDEDDPQWLPINAAKRLGVKYRLPQDSNRTWERFLAEKDARAAPITCFRVIGTLNDLVNECQAAAAVS